MHVALFITNETNNIASAVDSTSEHHTKQGATHDQTIEHSTQQNDVTETTQDTEQHESKQVEEQQQNKFITKSEIHHHADDSKLTAKNDALYGTYSKHSTNTNNFLSLMPINKTQNINKKSIFSICYDGITTRENFSSESDKTLYEYH